MRSQVKRDLRTPKYRMRVVKSSKGKGSYRRVTMDCRDVLDELSFDTQVRILVEKTQLFPCDVRKVLLAQRGVTLHNLPYIDPTVLCVTANGIVIGQPG